MPLLGYTYGIGPDRIITVNNKFSGIEIDVKAPDISLDIDVKKPDISLDIVVECKE